MTDMNWRVAIPVSQGQDTGNRPGAWNIGGSQRRRLSEVTFDRSI